MNMFKKSIIFKSTAVVLACLFAVNSTVYGIEPQYKPQNSTLAPTSAFKPIVNIKWDEKNDKYIIEENGKLDETRKTFNDDFAFVYLNYLIGQFLNELKTLTEKGLSKRGKDKHLDALKEAIDAYFPNASSVFGRFRFNEMEWDGDTLCLPYERKDNGQARLKDGKYEDVDVVQMLRYDLPQNRSDTPTTGFMPSLAKLSHVGIPVDSKGAKVILEDPSKGEARHTETPGASADLARYRKMGWRNAFEELAKIYGGKGAWNKILELLSPAIGFEMPRSEYLAIRDVWGKFLEHNKDLVNRGNELIEAETTFSGEGNFLGESIDDLRIMAQMFVMPDKVEEYIKSHAQEFKGWIIARSSGAAEDSYIRNLAGIFTSEKRPDPDLVVQAVKAIFYDAIYTIWINQNEKGERIEGVPNILTAETGFGILIQSFMEFEASGTAQTNYYGHTSIEAVMGDLETAVQGINANAVQFLFIKGSKEKFEFYPSFLSMPHTVKHKGKVYSVEDDPDEMRKLMAKFPKINGTFTPVNKSMAVKLNKIVNALEQEIGAPLDVEWGTYNKRLYIVQIRPTIGDFNKPLIEPAGELKKKEDKILARTPIAIGHTVPKGFTGRVVLVAASVQPDVIKTFEADPEFGKPYIRVQKDVASAVLGMTTAASVLVDPFQGSRQAHSINLITGRIASGEFSYCNGPVLKSGLYKHLHFKEHPSIRGVWISDESVTYFSSGLTAEFYPAADIKPGPVTQGDENEEISLLTIWRNSLARKLDEIKITCSADGIAEALFWGQYFIGKEIINYEVYDKANKAGAKSEMKRLLDEITYNHTNGGPSLEEILKKVEILKIILEFPLWPEPWERPLLMQLNKVIRFIEHCNAYKREENETKARPRQSIFRAVIYDRHNSYEHIEQQLEKHGKSDVVRFESSQRNVFANKLEEFEHDLDLAIIHVGGLDYVSVTVSDVRKIKEKNPNAVIIVETGLVDDYLLELAKQKQIILVRPGKHSEETIMKSAEECYAKWAEAKAIVMPVKPEKLIILFVKQDIGPRQALRDLIVKKFGLKKSDKGNYIGDEIELFVCNEQTEAIGILNSQKIGYVINGLEVDDEGKQFLKYVYEKGIKNLDIYSVDEIRVRKAQNQYPGAGIELFPSEDIKKIARIKVRRQKQLEAYEKDLAAYHAAQGKTASPVLQKPVYPEKCRVLLIDDQENGAVLVRTFNSKFPKEEFESLYARDFETAQKLLDAGTGFDLILYDIAMPRFDELKPYLIKSGAMLVAQTAYDADEVADKSGIGLAEKQEGFIHKPVRLDAYFKHIVKARKRQLEKYERQVAECRDVQQNVTPQPVKPVLSPTRICFIEENEDLASTYETVFGQLYPKDEYEFTVVRNVADAKKAMANTKFGVIFYDFMMCDFDSIQKMLIESSAVKVLVTGAENDEIRSRLSPDLRKHTGIALHKPSKLEKYEMHIKGARLSQIEAYKKEMAEYEAARAKPGVTPGGQKKTVFVLTNTSQEAYDLAKVAGDKLGAGYDVVPLSILWYLGFYLRTGKVPDVVIADATIDDNDEIKNIMDQTRAINPNAQFIFLSENARADSVRLKNEKNVLFVIERPFHFTKVLSSLESAKASEPANAPRLKTPPRGSPASLFKVMYEKFPHEKVGLKRLTDELNLKQSVVYKDVNVLYAAGLLRKYGRGPKALFEPALAYVKDEILKEIYQKLVFLGTVVNNAKIQKTIREVIEARGGTIKLFPSLKGRDRFEIELPEEAKAVQKTDGSKVWIQATVLAKVKDGLRQEYRWDTEAQGVANVRDAVKKNMPDLVERAGNFSKLTLYQQEALKDDFYNITSYQFKSWGLVSALVKDHSPYFQGAHGIALLKSFPELGLNILGFQLDWTTREKAIESIRFVLSRKAPSIIARYDDLDHLDKYEIQTLKDEIYSIETKQMSVWGLASCFSKKTVPHFGGGYANALIATFPKLDLDPLGFYLDWENKPVESLRFSLSTVFPDIVIRYGNIDTLTEDEKESLREDIYNIPGGIFHKPPLTTPVQKRVVPLFEGSYKKALMISFSKLDLNILGFGRDWTTREKATESVRYILRHRVPSLMRQYDRLSEMTEPEREALREEFYRITPMHFQIWGMMNSLNSRYRHLFDCDHVKALQAAVPLLHLDELGFRLDFSSKKGVIKSFRYVFSKKIPSIMERYGRLSKLSADEIELLKIDVCSIRHAQLKVWGLTRYLETRSKVHFNGLADGLMHVFPRLKLNPLDFQLDWSTKKRTLKSFRHRLYQKVPDIMARYDKLKQLTPDQVDILKRDIYDTMDSIAWRSWNLDKGVIDWFGGSYKAAFVGVFPELGLTPLGFEPDWSTFDKACESIRFALWREQPHIIAQFNRIDKLSPAELDNLKKEINRIKKTHFKAWGMIGALKSKHFNNDPFLALNAALNHPKLFLDREGYNRTSGSINSKRFKWKGITKEQAVANIREAIRTNRPDIMERYDNLDSLDKNEIEVLRSTVYKLSSKHLKLWGMYSFTQIKVVPYFQGHYREVFMAALPKLELEALEFGPDWTTIEKTMESFRYNVRRAAPEIMELYDNFDYLTPEKKDLLRKKIYAIDSVTWIVWGCQGGSNKWFGHRYVKAILALFPKLDSISIF